MVKRGLLAALAAAAIGTAYAAEVPGEYDRMDTALRAAMDDCRAAGGTWSGFTWAQTERWALERTPTGYRITGAGLSIVCKIERAAGPPDWLLTWDRPTTRADGSLLPPDQIAGYQITIEGQPVAMAAGTSYKAAAVPVGTMVELRTVDTGGLLSAPVALVLQ